MTFVKIDLNIPTLFRFSVINIPAAMIIGTVFIMGWAIAQIYIDLI